MDERLTVVDYPPNKRTSAGPALSLRTAFAASFLTLLSGGSMHHPKENQNARPSAAAADISHSGNTIIMAAVYNAPPKALIAPPKIPAVALADIKPKADLLNQRFMLEGDETPVGIDLEEEQCTLVIGDARLRIVSTKSESGKVQQLDKKTVQKYRESCHLRRTKKGVRAYGVIIPWLWEPSFELSDVELQMLKKKTIAALQEKLPECMQITVKLERGDKSVEVTLEYEPQPFTQLAAASSVDSR